MFCCERPAGWWCVCVCVCLCTLLSTYKAERKSRIYVIVNCFRLHQRNVPQIVSYLIAAIGITEMTDNRFWTCAFLTSHSHSHSRFGMLNTSFRDNPYWKKGRRVNWVRATRLLKQFLLFVCLQLHFFLPIRPLGNRAAQIYESQSQMPSTDSSICLINYSLAPLPTALYCALKAPAIC